MSTRSAIYSFSNSGWIFEDRVTLLLLPMMFVSWLCVCSFLFHGVFWDIDEVVVLKYADDLFTGGGYDLGFLVIEQLVFLQKLVKCFFPPL